MAKKIAMFTGSVDPHYQIDLLGGLSKTNLEIDFLAGDSMKCFSIIEKRNVRFFNVRGDQNPNSCISIKIRRVLYMYFRLLKYSFNSDAEIFHIQWPNKFVLFDRVVMNLIYKILKKKLVHTAHNVDESIRDGGRNNFQKIGLKLMYKMMDHIIVHTNLMKRQLRDFFNVEERKISVIKHGINDAIKETNILCDGARLMLGIDKSERVLLFFGNITPYKGLDKLIKAYPTLIEKSEKYKLIIAGKVVRGKEWYWKMIDEYINQNIPLKYLIKKIEFIPDNNIELYFKAADVLILPYTYIFQSGILFIAYKFGLPVIATDVGSLREDIIHGQTGYICKSDDPKDIAEMIEMYFKNKENNPDFMNRKSIKDHAKVTYSWDEIGQNTFQVYQSLI